MDKVQAKPNKAVPQAVKPSQAKQPLGATLKVRPTATPSRVVQGKKVKEAQEEIASVEAEEKVSILKPGILIRAAALAVVNLLAIVTIVFIQGKLQAQAREIKRLRSIQLSVAEGEAVVGVRAEIESAQSGVNELKQYFSDEAGIVNFIGEIDKLKKDGVVASFSFVSNSPIKDKTGALGLPFVVQIRGNWSQIDTGMQRIMSLPFVLRTIQIESKPADDDQTIIDFKFGGFLYAKDTFSQN